MTSSKTGSKEQKAGRTKSDGAASSPKKSKPPETLESIHSRPPEPDAPQWDLRLYVAGQSAKSLIAFSNLKRICEEHLQGQYRIEVIDLLENPQLAKGDQILAIPTLVRKLPPPLKKIIGDLSNTERTLVGLDLLPHNG